MRLRGSGLAFGFLLGAVHLGACSSGNLPEFFGTDAGADGPSTDSGPDASVELDARAEAAADAADAGVDAKKGACPGNRKQTRDILSNQCQAALEDDCCAELTACFNIVPPSMGTLDCNGYAKCIVDCRGAPKLTVCQDQCQLATTKPVFDAYEKIATCAASSPAATAACR